MTQHLCALLFSHRFRFADERDLQEGIEMLLVKDGQEFDREVKLNATDRIDFLLGDVGLEVKIDGSLSSVTRQLWRYAKVDRIKELVLVTSRMAHTRMPNEMNGKPLWVVHLSML